MLRPDYRRKNVSNHRNDRRIGDGRVTARSPGAHVEMDRVVPPPQQAMPYIRVSGADLTEFEQRARSSPHVERLGSLEGVNNRGLYRAEWIDDVESPVIGIARADASVLGAGGVDVTRAYSPEETGEPE